jgi:hypothetical protein
MRITFVMILSVQDRDHCCPAKIQDTQEAQANPSLSLLLCVPRSCRGLTAMEEDGLPLPGHRVAAVLGMGGEEKAYN